MVGNSLITSNHNGTLIAELALDQNTVHVDNSHRIIRTRIHIHMAQARWLQPQAHGRAV